MRCWSFVLTLVFSAAAALLWDSRAEAQPKPDPAKTKVIMRKKLELSQKLLEALVMNRLDDAAAQAQALQELRKDPAFKVYQSPEYELFGSEFTSSAEGIIKAAKDKNLEAAKLHYLGMTMTCFHCHTYTRDQKVGLK